MVVQSDYFKSPEQRHLHFQKLEATLNISTQVSWLAC